MYLSNNHPKICSSCKAVLSDEQKFCHCCGAAYVPPLQNAPQHCSMCGQKLPSGSSFCPGCGAKTVLPLAQPPIPNMTSPSAQPPVLTMSEPPVQSTEFAVSDATAAQAPNAEIPVTLTNSPAEGCTPKQDPGEICINCNTILSSAQAFCHVCGTRKPPRNICPNCNTKNTSQAAFCVSCGSRLQGNAFTYGYTDRSRTPSLRNIKISKPHFLSRILILIVSFLLLISSFLPVFNSEIEMDDHTVTIDHSAWDGIVLFMDSFHQMSTGELDDSMLYEDFRSQMEEINESVEKLEDKYDDEWEDHFSYDSLSPLIKLEFRLLYRSEYIEPTLNMGICALIGLLYIILTAWGFISSLRSFLSAFKNNSTVLASKSLKWLALIPAHLLVWFAAFNVSGYSIEGSEISVFDVVTYDSTPSFNWILAFIAALITVIAIIAFKYWNTPFTQRNRKNLIKRSIVCALAFILVLFTIAPIFYVSADTERSVSPSTTFDATLFESLVLSDAEKYEIVRSETYTNYDYYWNGSYMETYPKYVTLTSRQRMIQTIENLFDRLDRYNAYQIKNHEADYCIQSLIIFKTLGFGAYSFSWAFGLGGTAIIIVALCAALLIWKNLYALATDTAPKKRWTIPIKILLVLTAVGVLGVISIISVLATLNVNENGFLVIPHINSVLLLAVSIALACVPMGKTKESAPVVSDQ